MIVSLDLYMIKYYFKKKKKITIYLEKIKIKQFLLKKKKVMTYLEKIKIKQFLLKKNIYIYAYLFLKDQRGQKKSLLMTINLIYHYHHDDL